MRLSNILVSGLLVCLLALPLRADVLCDGTDDSVTTGLALSTFITASAFTVMGWTNVAFTPPSALICWRGAAITSDAGGVVLLGRKNSSNFCGYAFDGSDHELTASSSAGWHHLALRLSSGTLALFVDGVSAATTSMSPVSDLTPNVDICGGEATEPSSGDRMGNVQWFNSALSDQEIASRALSRIRLVGPTTPTADWQLDDCADGAAGNSVSFRDRSGNARHGTGDDGANNSGLTCQASNLLSYPVGPQ